MRLTRSRNTRGVPLDQAALLAGAVGKLWGELVATRHALWQREAELAAGVPLILREDEHAPPLSERLEAVLRGGAQAIGCDAAALYLLDPATTELKLRSSWGLPRKRLTDPARPLRGALADLEALLGHAVVLTDHAVARLLESARARLCRLRVRARFEPHDAAGHTVGLLPRGRATSTTPQTNILEVVAGRIVVRPGARSAGRRGAVARASTPSK